MNQLLLSRRLGLASPQAFQRAQYERLLHALTPEESLRFDAQHVDRGSNPRDAFASSRLQGPDPPSSRNAAENAVAHSGGINVLDVDNQTGRYLISGGADSTIHLWDLEERETASPYTHHPTSSTTRSSPGSHTHALTSLSIYPFDPTPSTILTTSYDKTLKLHSITPTQILPVHTFPLLETPYTHSLSPLPSSTSSSLIAVGTSHPTIQLLDLRTSLTTHTLPGPSGAIFSLSWSPNSSHILASGSSDGRVLFFDVRRAHSAFACLDHDDALGVLRSSVPSASTYRPRSPLSWTARAHTGPVTGVRWASSGRKLVTCGQDQRIRIWDAATGRNELVHFGPRIRNQRNREFNPLASPGGCGREGKEMLVWANDEGKGEVFVLDMNEGTTLKILRTPGVGRSVQKVSKSDSAKGRLSSGGRINSLAWRVRGDADTGLELYSAHGDGSIHCWKALPAEDQELDDPVDVEGEAEKKRKRKRDLLDGIVEGLTKKSVTFT